MIDNLTKEIIQRIIMNVGAAPGIFGMRGITDPNLRITKTITVKYDDCDREHDVYTGKIAVTDNSTIRGLLVNLSVDDIDEYLFLFRMDEYPIHAAQVTYDDFDEGTSIKRLINKAENGIWEPLGMFHKARLLAEFERFVSWGCLWEDCSEINDLYKAAVNLIDAQRY